MVNQETIDAIKFIVECASDNRVLDQNWILMRTKDFDKSKREMINRGLSELKSNTSIIMKFKDNLMNQQSQEETKTAASNLLDILSEKWFMIYYHESTYDSSIYDINNVIEELEKIKNM